MALSCPACSSKYSSSEFQPRLICYGKFYRRSDHQLIQRYRCKGCKKSFSKATYSACIYQKKRHLNARIMEELVSGVSQRRAARLIKVNRKTIVRKFIFMAKYAHLFLPLFNAKMHKTTTMSFDDLESFEHTKCKPLSITLAVEHPSRRILGFQVAQMPAKGMLTSLAQKKYGPRKDERKQKRRTLFNELKNYVSENAEIRSDQNPHYIATVKEFFPRSEHTVFKGRRGCVVGQGELKRGGFDPLFSLNHTCAMLRANINRLFRKTWCTTKKAERLSDHIALYSLYHNLILIHSPSK